MQSQQVLYFYQYFPNSFCWTRCYHIHMNKQNTKQLEETYKSRSKLYINYAYHILGDEYLAQDVVQNVFCSAMDQNIFDSHENPSAWLMVAIKNQSVDIIRKRSYEIVDIKKESPFHDPAINRIEIDMTLQAILSDKEYTIAKMFWIEEKSEKQIAEKLNISLNVLRVRIHRIRHKIRENGTILLFISIIIFAKGGNDILGRI